MMLLWLLGCSEPLAEVYASEAVWWRADGIASLGIEPVVVPAGEPVGYWPRIVVGPDAYMLDNRAWVLSHEEPEASSVFERDVRGDRRALLDAALDLADIHRTHDDWVPILVVPDHGVGWERVFDALYVAGQAGFPNMALGAAVPTGAGLRIRAVDASTDQDCKLQAWHEPERGVLRFGSRWVRTEEPAALLQAVHEACEPTWWKVSGEVLSMYPGVEAPTERWMCLRVDTSTTATSKADTVLKARSMLYAHPAVQQGWLVHGVPRPEPSELAPHELCEEDALQTALHRAMDRRASGLLLPL